MIKDIISNNKKKAEILLVEDSHAQALKLKYLLKEHGFSCVLAKNGWEALSKTKENKPDLIISDIVMPEMDGYELCRNLKTDNILKNIPVILLTALTGTENIIKGLNVNSDFYITKPYEENFLLSKINFLLSKKITGQSDVDEELEIVLNGKLHKISANKKQILNFLVSTHENLVFQNQALTQTQKALKKLNENLEEKVKEKTAHLLTEITERKQTEEALRESEEKFDAMLRSI
ncbi:MAG: response regulator, partial [Desulfobacterales bacterium]|nr:response regulator [Desulfobacterales bacterium]